MTRKKILETAIKLTCADRELSHGSPEDTFGLCAELWSAYLGEKVHAEDVCHMMTMLKIARMRHGQLNPDDYVDSVGYEAIAGELAGAKL